MEAWEEIKLYLQPNFFYKLIFGTGVCKLWSSFTRIIDFVSHKANPKELFSALLFIAIFILLCVYALFFLTSTFDFLLFQLSLEMLFPKQFMLTVNSFSPLTSLSIFPSWLSRIFFIFLHNKVKWPLVVVCYILETFTIGIQSIFTIVSFFLLAWNSFSLFILLFLLHPVVENPEHFNFHT